LALTQVLIVFASTTDGK